MDLVFGISVGAHIVGLSPADGICRWRGRAIIILLDGSLICTAAPPLSSRAPLCLAVFARGQTPRVRPACRRLLPRGPSLLPSPRRYMFGNHTLVLVPLGAASTPASQSYSIAPPVGKA